MKNNNNFFAFLLGINLVFFGCAVIVKPTFTSLFYKFNYDFTGYNMPFGIGLIIAGIFCIWTIFRKKKK